MRSPRRRTWISVALIAGLLIANVASGTADPARPASSTTAPFAGGQLALPLLTQPTQTPTVDAQVNIDPTGQPLTSGFLGVSIEYPALHVYTGRDPRRVDPVLVKLLAALAPGQRPVVRVGGDSADQTWLPIRGTLPPHQVNYALTPDWLSTAHGLARDLNARMILGVNFAGNRPAVAGAEARALLHGVSPRYLDAFEIGNEPDLYGAGGWFRAPNGTWVYARPRSWDMKSMIRDYARWKANLPVKPIVGPSFASLAWMNQLSSFLSAERALRMVTVHRYPLRGCTTDPNSPIYPTIPALLSDSSAAAMASGIAPYAAQSHAAGLPFRVDEMNSVACRGRWGVSDTFASALWAIDTLYNFAAVGVDGVNFHMLPGAAYELFSPAEHAGHWSAFVRPEYYGLLFFARGFPVGAHLLQVNVPSGPVKVYATRGRDGHVRVMMINKDSANPVTVSVQIQYASGTATVQRLTAPSVSAKRGVTLGGQSFGNSTPSGSLRGAPQSEPVAPGQNGAYSVSLPAGSAALLTR